MDAREELQALRRMAELEAKAQVAMPKSPQQQMQNAFDAKKANFFQRVGNDYDKRVAIGQKSADEYVAGKQSLPETIAQQGLNMGVALGSDVIGQGLVSAGRGLNNITFGGAGKAGQYVLDSVANSPLGDAGKYIGNAYSNFETESPRFARNVNAVGNLLGVAGAFTPIKGGVSAVGAAEKAAIASGKVAKQVGKEITDATVKIAPNVSPEIARKAGGQLLEKAKQSGALIPAEKATEFIDNLNTTIKPTSEWAGAIKQATPIDDFLKNLETLRNKPMSLDDAMQLDSELGKFAHSPQNFVNGKYSPAGTDALKMQKSLSEMIDNADDVIDPSALVDWKNGKKQWAASIRANKINNIIDNSQYFDHPATSIRVGMRGIVKNKNEFARYSKEEQKLIRRAAETGIVTDTLRLGASGLGPIISGVVGGTAGAAFGGPVGAAVGAAMASAPAMALREGSKAIATSRQTARATDALNSVLSQGAGLPTKKLTMNQIMKLPQEQRKFYLKEDLQKAFEAKKLKGK